MIVRKQAQELILGVSRDPVFGPVILFGAGGVAVEVMDDTAIALPPLDDVLAGDLIDRTRIGRLLAGFRDRKPADRGAISLALNGLSQMIVDFPCIASVDINPLLADSEGVIALDARIEIEPQDVERVGPNPTLRSGRIRPVGQETSNLESRSLICGRSGRRTFRSILPSSQSCRRTTSACVFSRREEAFRTGCCSGSLNSTMTGKWPSWRSIKQTANSPA